MPARRREDIAVAVTEAATNVVVHAYRGEEPGPLDVTAALSVATGTLLVAVCDWGRAPLPRSDSPGLGLGIPLMGRLSDAMQIRPNDGDGGTRVSLVFRRVTAAIGAPVVSDRVRRAMSADEDAEALRQYVGALVASTGPRTTTRRRKLARRWRSRGRSGSRWPTSDRRPEPRRSRSSTHDAGAWRTPWRTPRRPTRSISSISRSPSQRPRR